MANSEGAFPNTRWSLIRRAANAPRGRDEPLAAVFELYRPALRRLLLRKWHLQQEDADEVFQDFFATQVIEKNLLSRADEARRFRNFIATCMENHLRNWFRSRNRRAMAELDDDGPAARDRSDGITDMDREWAFEVLKSSVADLKAHFHRTGRMDLLQVYSSMDEPVLFGNGRTESFQSLAAKLGLRDEKHGRGKLSSARRRMRDTIRDRLALEARNPADVDRLWDELREIFSSWRSFDPDRGATISDDSSLDWDTLMEASQADSNAQTLLSRESLLKMWMERACQFDLGALDASAQQGAPEHDASQNRLLVDSIGALLRYERPPVELLKMLKHFAKVSVASAQTRKEEEVFLTLYYLALAAGIVRCSERFSQLPADKLRQGFAWAANWADPPEQRLLQEATRLIDLKASQS